MSKKLLALLMAMVLSVYMLAGCGASEEAPTDAPAQEEQAVEEEKKEEEKPAEEKKEEAPAVEASETGMVETFYDPDFSIEKLENGIKKVIDGDKRELILVPRELEEVPAEYADSIVVRTPVERAVFLSSTQTCFFRAVDRPDLVDSIAGVSDGDWTEIELIDQGLKDGKIQQVSSGMGEADYELIQSLDPDIVFVYTGTSPQTEHIEKFKELGINYAVDNEYMESNYMARMEWMRFVLTFFNADEDVDKVMEAAQKRLDDAKAEIAGKEAPKVAIFSVSGGNVYGTSDSSWLGSMIKDMGGSNVFGDLPAGPVTPEAAFEAAQDADVIIYSSTPEWCNGMAGIKENFPLIEDCKAYENDNIYQYDDSFWMGIDKSDVMAVEMCSIFYPEVFNPGEMDFFVKVAK